MKKIQANFSQAIISAVLLLCVGFSLPRISNLSRELRFNVANKLLYNTLIKTDVEADDRQRALAVASRLLDTNAEHQSDTHTHAMIPAILQALHYHRLGDHSAAARWYLLASQANPSPARQMQLWASPWVKVTEAGDYQLDPKGWKVRADSSANSQLELKADSSLHIACTPTLDPEQLSRAAFEWNKALELPYHHTATLRAKVAQDVMLIVETVVNQELVRHSTLVGNGEWTDISFTIAGNHLTNVYLLLRETPTTRSECSAEIEQVIFSLDTKAVSSD